MIVAKCTFNRKMAWRLHNDWEYRRLCAKGDYRVDHHLWKYALGYVVTVIKDPRDGVPFYGNLLPAGWFNIEWIK